jgi:ribonuclease T2
MTKAVRAGVASVCGLFLLCVGLSSANAGKRRRQTGGEFDYYMLVLSYAPDFCVQPRVDKDPRECGKGRRTGFVVHGLWPQGESTRGPESCGPARPVAQALVRLMLNYLPTESLIQHEWAQHGTCSGLPADEYFAQVRKARDSLSLPPELKQPSQSTQIGTNELESKLAAANPRYPKDAFRTSCYTDGELREVRVCMNKDLSPRTCGASAGECRLTTVTLLPVR